ncbi:NUDIX hydrolase [Metapseudomonas otitidis]|uniref:NUDIX hydrolase n=1 Tax=Pseudomonadaceae TaxID=135621 RepID=UPI0005C820A9|nr:NUDIX hydrolase [Pseudomonas sp. FeS53a]KIV61720.1 Nudix-related transcriptional regulator NrtR [Pseudomonas sp. FeS53a]
MSSAQVLASVDIVALRLDPAQGLDVLLIRRAQGPFEGEWALPGVLVNGRCADDDLDAAAKRALGGKARVEPQHLEQVATVGNARRDPRGWSLSTFYLALLAPDTEVTADDLRFAPLEGLAGLPFDHDQLVVQARERLSSKSVYTSLPLHLLAPRFTVTEALGAFQACLGQPVQHTTLRGRLEKMKGQGWIVDTGEQNHPKMGRPQKVLEHRPGAGGLFTFDRSVLS